MNLSVVPGAVQPLYQQLYDRVALGVLRGEITPGSAIPPIRAVAQELKISVISVKRAWEELERDGYICTAVGRGTTAAPISPEERERKKRAIMAEKLRDGAAFCRALGASPEEAADILRSEMEA